MDWDKVVQELAVIEKDARTQLVDIRDQESRNGWLVRYHTAAVMRQALAEGLCPAQRMAHDF